MTKIEYEVPEAHRLVINAAVEAIIKVMGTAEKYYPLPVWKQQPTEHHFRKGHLHAMRGFENKDSRDWGTVGGTPSTGCLDAEHALTRLAMGLAQYVSAPEPTIVVDDAD